MEYTFPKTVKSIKIANLLNEFKEFFPELLDWIQSTLINKIFFEYVKVFNVGREKEFNDNDNPVFKTKCILSIFTENYDYGIYATKPTKDDFRGYLGACVSLRKPYAGEQDLYTADLSDGNYEYETWLSIVKKIIMNEIVELSPYSYEPAPTYNIIPGNNSIKPVRNLNNIDLIEKFRDIFPELFKWIQSTIIPKIFNDCVKVLSVWKKTLEGSEKTQIIGNLSIYTDTYIYYINAYKPSDNIPKGRLIAMVTLRKPLAGNEGVGQNDLIDADYNYETWIDIIRHILKYEIVRLGPRVYYPPTTSDLENSK